jgi:hypothetical protein
MCEFCNGVRGDGCVVCGSGDVGFELRADGEWDMRLSPNVGINDSGRMASELPWAEPCDVVSVESIASDVAYAVKQLGRMRLFHSLTAIVDAGERALAALERVEGRLLEAV